MFSSFRKLLSQVYWSAFGWFDAGPLLVDSHERENLPLGWLTTVSRKN